MTEDYNETNRKTHVLYEDEFLDSDEFCLNMLNHLDEKSMNYILFFFSSLLYEVNLPLYCYVYFSERKTLAAQLTRLLLIRIKWVKT